jgi:hypothetical protein
MLRVLLLAVACVAALAACTTLRGGKLVAPEHFGLEQVTPQLYVERGADAATRERLHAATERAREAVRLAFGDVRSRAVVHACLTEACYARFGGIGSIAKVYGDRILLSPRGLNWHFIAHEWSHAELHARLGLRAWLLRVPRWFDEGLAVAVSEAPEHSEAHWLYLESAGVPRPTPAELRGLRSSADWHAALGRYGELENRERAARGEPEIRPVYAAAGRQVRPWLRERGAAGLQKLIAQLRAGADFDSAFAAQAATSGSR